MKEPNSLIITKLRRAGHDELEANVTLDRETLPVQRWWGSWGTIPDERGSYKHVPFEIARVLQDRARSFERREQQQTTGQNDQGGNPPEESDLAEGRITWKVAAKPIAA